MTNLERTLASILALIAKARAGGPSAIPATLLQRKAAICAALAAPEHAWHAPRAPADVQRASDKRATEMALAETCP
jgi:hypothetical protein